MDYVTKLNEYINELNKLLSEVVQNRNENIEEEKELNIKKYQEFLKVEKLKEDKEKLKLFPMKRKKLKKGIFKKCFISSLQWIFLLSFVIGGLTILLGNPFGSAAFISLFTKFSIVTLIVVLGEIVESVVRYQKDLIKIRPKMNENDIDLNIEANNNYIKEIENDLSKHAIKKIEYDDKEKEIMESLEHCRYLLEKLNKNNEDIEVREEIDEMMVERSR